MGAVVRAGSPTFAGIIGEDIEELARREDDDTLVLAKRLQVPVSGHEIPAPPAIAVASTRSSSSSSATL